MHAANRLKGHPLPHWYFLQAGELEDARVRWQQRPAGSNLPLARGRVTLLHQLRDSKLSPWLLLEKTFQDFLLPSSSTDITPVYLCFSQFLL